MRRPSATITTPQATRSCAGWPPTPSPRKRPAGPVASAWASWRRLRSSRVRVPARVLARAARPVRARAARAGALARRSARPPPKIPPTRTFSKTVRASKGCGIWWVSAMPARQRACGAIRVTSRSSKTTAPRSGRRRPIRRLSAVVLPAPFGPMTPSASPGVPERPRSPMTRRQPNAFETPRSASSALSRGRSHLADGPELGGGGDARGGPVADHRHVEAEVLAAPPLPAHERGLGDVGHRPLGPADRAHDRAQVGRLDRGDHRALVVHGGGALEDGGGHLEEGGGEAERLRPLLLRCLRGSRGQV